MDRNRQQEQSLDLKAVTKKALLDREGVRNLKRLNITLNSNKARLVW